MDFTQQSQKKKKGTKKNKRGKSTVQNQASGNFNNLTAGEKFLTPSIEYYKNVANQYKKTLNTLAINQPGAQAKPVPEIVLGLTDSARGNIVVNDGRNDQPYMFQHSKDLKTSAFPVQNVSESLNSKQTSTQLIPQQQINNEYSTTSILKNAKSEKLMFDIEQFKIRTKKEFNHEVQGKQEINQYFGKMNECIDQLVDKVQVSVNVHRKDFFDRFKGEMYNIHSNYRELQESTNENLNKMKLKKEILDRQAERDWFKNECNKIDNKCHEKQDELFMFKDRHNEYLQEKKFLDEQIATSKENKVNLEKRQQELMEELAELKEGGEVKEQVRESSLEKGDPDYFENSVKKFKDHIAHLQKRNEIERKTALKKQLQSEKFEEATYPFELIFQDSVGQVKEEMVERRHRSLRRGMNTSKSALSIRFGDNIKTPDGLPDQFQHKSIFNRFDLEIDHIRPTNFTDSDKKKVIENFMQNEEVLFFVYGLLFPQSVMNMQSMQQVSQLQEQAAEEEE